MPQRTATTKLLGWRCSHSRRAPGNHHNDDCYALGNSTAGLAWLPLPLASKSPFCFVACPALLLFACLRPTPFPVVPAAAHLEALAQEVIGSRRQPWRPRRAPADSTRQQQEQHRDSNMCAQLCSKRLRCDNVQS